MNERRSKTILNAMRRFIFPVPVWAPALGFVVGFILSIAVSIYFAGG